MSMTEYIVTNEQGENQQFHELIRCKDCKWYRIDILKHDGTIDKRFKPTRCTLRSRDMNEQDYCSRAERKEE